MKTTFKILVISAILSLVWLFLSCGSRKAQVEKQKEETKTEITDNSYSEGSFSENVKSETKIKVDDKNETVTTETVYSVIDPQKEAFIVENDGTKTKLSNVVKTIRVKTEKKNTQTNTEEKKEEAKQADYKQQNNIEISKEEKKELKQKETENTRIPVWYWIVGLVILVVIYISYRIYKKLPINPF